MEQLAKQYREQLKKIMIDRIMSYYQLAQEIGIGEQTARDLISEARKPTVFTLKKLKEYFRKLDEGKK